MHGYTQNNIQMLCLKLNEQAEYSPSTGLVVYSNGFDPTSVERIPSALSVLSRHRLRDPEQEMLLSICSHRVGTPHAAMKGTSLFLLELDTYPLLPVRRYLCVCFLRMYVFHVIFVYQFMIYFAYLVIVTYFYLFFTFVSFFNSHLLVWLCVRAQ